MNQQGRAISDSERVRDAADIVRIVGEHVALKARGREYAGLCPFHDDHSPSMYVVPQKQIFHCFVCGAGGDVFTFIQKYHRMEFREALEHLAERCNVELTRRGPGRAEGPGGGPGQAQGGGASRSDIAGANAQAAAFFRAVLHHAEYGAPGRQLIERRGISGEMVERFTLGLAPDRWDGLAMKIASLGADPGLYVASGLLKRRDDGSRYDAFRNRLIFPIRDQIGRVIAFGARRIDDADEPKYLNSPETALFSKSNAIFGIHQAARAIQKSRTAIVTEGYTDVIACHQHGFENAVATLGTALTAGHATILRRLCDTVVLLFDGDDAGRRAADRAVEVFFAESLDVRIATLDRHTDAKDPDELLKREGGDDVFRRAIDESADLLEYRFGRLRDDLAGAGMAALERATNEEVSRLAQLGFHRVSPIRRQLVLRRLHEITGVRESTLAAQLGRARAAGAGRGASETEPSASTRAEPDPHHLVGLLGCVLTDGVLWSGLSGDDRAAIGPDAYRSPTMRAIATAVRQISDSGRSPSLRSVLDELEDTDAKAAAVALQTQTEQTAENRLRAYFEDCLTASRRAAQGASAPGGDLASLVELKRRHIAEFGPDRRKLARPAGS